MGAPSLQINDAIGQQEPSPLRMANGRPDDDRPLGWVMSELVHSPEPIMQTEPVLVDRFSVQGPGPRSHDNAEVQRTP